MKRFEERMEQDDVKPGTFVVSVGFDLPNWKINDTEENVFVYEKKAGSNHMSEAERVIRQAEKKQQAQARQEEIDKRIAEDNKIVEEVKEDGLTEEQRKELELKKQQENNKTN